MTTLNTPYYPQLEERDCGATCLRMVLAHHGLAVPMERLRDLSGTDERGTDLAGLTAAAEALGLGAIAADLSYDDLLSADLWPVILHWEGDHFVVVTRVTPEGVHLLDPALGERTLDRDTFEGHRLGAGRSRAGLVVVAPIAPVRPREARPDAEQRFDTTPQPTRPPAPVWLTGLLYGGFVAAGLYALLRVLRLAVDLQFRETWLSNLGVLLLVLAATLLGRYLLRRTVIQYADAAGAADIASLTQRLEGDAALPGRSGATTLATRLIEDVDTLRLWRAYRLGSIFAGTAVAVVALTFAFGIDAAYGLGLTAAAIAVGVASFTVGIAEPDVKQRALRSQVAQREGFIEYARLLPELIRGRKPGDWLRSRLEVRNRGAARSFDEVTAEVVARTDLKLTLAWVCATLLLCLGLYRLGYEGLQVGDFLFALFLTWVVFVEIRSVADAYHAYGRTSDARARLADLRTTAPRVPNRPTLREAETLQLSWRAPLGNHQAFEFAYRSHLALTGTDYELRQTLIDACLGRENRLDARLAVAGEEPRGTDLTQLGAVAYLSPASPLLSGTLAENIVLDAQIDHTRLDAIATRVGLLGGTLPAGLSTRVDVDGSRADHATFVKTILARALYADPDIYVLDGLTDALPAYDEALVFDELLAAAGTKLVICNARRQSATYGFDKIVQLEAGEIEASGTHDYLKRSGGAYALQLATETGIER